VALKNVIVAATNKLTTDNEELEKLDIERKRLQIAKKFESAGVQLMELYREVICDHKDVQRVHDTDSDFSVRVITRVTTMLKEDPAARKKSPTEIVNEAVDAEFKDLAAIIRPPDHRNNIPGSSNHLGNHTNDEGEAGPSNLNTAVCPYNSEPAKEQHLQKVPHFKKRQLPAPTKPISFRMPPTTSTVAAPKKRGPQATSKSQRSWDAALGGLSHLDLFEG